MEKPEVLEMLERQGYKVELNEDETKINYYQLQAAFNNITIIEPLLDKLKMEKQRVINYLTWENQIYSNLVAVDIETTGLRPLKSDIRLISWASSSGSHVSEKVEEEIAYILEDSSVLKVFHNVMFDVPFLQTKGIVVNNYTDTMIMSQILGEKGQSHSLDALAERELGKKIDKRLQKPDNWKGELTLEHLEYSRIDAELTYSLAVTLVEKLKKSGLLGQLRRNERALPFAVRAKMDGIGFDKAAWQIQLKHIATEREKVKDRLLTELGADINPNAPEQLKLALRYIGIHVDDTKDETLAAIESIPVVESIREYRKIDKLVSSTGNRLLNFVDWDGRIRASWNIYGTITGRMSCSDPNIQQIGKEIKPFFGAKDGYVLVDCDYSQIELRVVAEIARDKEMIEAFKNGEDLHKKTARMVFGKDSVSKEQRQIAKTCNFGLIYGMTEKGLQTRLKQTSNIDITIQEAETFRQKFFFLYKGIRSWQLKTYNKLYVTSIGGKRWKGHLLSPLEKYNYPVQGSAAEGLKEAMAIIISEIPNNWKICAVIHDEVLLEVPIEEAEIAKEKLEGWMVAGMSKILKEVPVVAEAAIFNTWQKA